jgi:hypothetical protein
MRKVLMIILILIAGLIVLIQAQPSTYHVERSTTVNAPADAIYSHVSDFNQWAAWSPWEKLDPAMKKDYSGAPGTVGESYHWAGNDKVGEGRMTINKLDPGKDVGIDLEFIKPFAGKCQTAFALAPEATATKVTWSIDGKSDFVSKAMCLFGGNMDKMIGPDFEHGLAGLKSVVEASPAAAATTAPGTTPADSAAAKPAAH